MGGFDPRARQGRVMGDAEARVVRVTALLDKIFSSHKAATGYDKNAREANSLATAEHQRARAAQARRDAYTAKMQIIAALEEGVQ